MASLAEMGRLLELPSGKTQPFSRGKSKKEKGGICYESDHCFSGCRSGHRPLVHQMVHQNGQWLRKKEIRVQEGLSGIEVALTKRCDMLTKMLDTAKGYMAHESELFTKVIELRRGMSVAEMNDAQQQMDALSGRLFAVAENYPELRSSNVFVELQRGIRDAEEHLQAARRLYNSSVTAYNTAIAMFPAKLLAGSRQPKEFFAAEAGKREDVKMSF